MSAEINLLDKVAEVCQLNDSQIGAKLGRTRSLIHLWRRGKSHMADEDIAKLCALASLDGPKWALEIHIDRAENRAEKALWRSALDRLSAAAAVVALMLPFAGGLKAENLDNSTGYQAADAHSLYIMFRRWLARIVHRPRPQTGWSLTHA